MPLDSHVGQKVHPVKILHLEHYCLFLHVIHFRMTLMAKETVDADGHVSQYMEFQFPLVQHHEHHDYVLL